MNSSYGKGYHCDIYKAKLSSLPGDVWRESGQIGLITKGVKLGRLDVETFLSNRLKHADIMNFNQYT